MTCFNIVQCRIYFTTYYTVMSICGTVTFWTKWWKWLKNPFGMAYLFMAFNDWLECSSMAL